MLLYIAGSEIAGSVYEYGVFQSQKGAECRLDTLIAKDAVLWDKHSEDGVDHSEKYYHTYRNSYIRTIEMDSYEYGEWAEYSNRCSTCHQKADMFVAVKKTED